MLNTQRESGHGGLFPTNGRNRGVMLSLNRTQAYTVTDSETSGERVAVGVAVGLALGVGIGVAIDNIGLGIGIGMALGAALGFVWDKQDA